jgi:cyclic beta-1,2-glucan synthetase
VRSGEGAIVATHMAHHQGMTLVALANVLLGRSDGRTVPRRPAFRRRSCCCRSGSRAGSGHRAAAGGGDACRAALAGARPRRLRTPHTPYPRAQILSNGNYVAIVTNWWRRHELLPRPRGDALARGPHARPGSQFVYLRDVHSGAVWSAAYQPTAKEPDDYLVEFLAEKAVFERLDYDIATRLEIVVSPGDDAEVRRVSLTNRSDRPREIEVTSYVELGLGSIAEDFANPAFGRLFVETEWIAEDTALLARRRSRAASAAAPVTFHVLSVQGPTQAQVEWETDRMRFLGRGRATESPQAMDGRALSGTTGAVLDPILSLRTRLRLAPGRSRASRSPPESPATRRALAIARRSTTITGLPPGPSRSPTRKRRWRCGTSACRSSRPGCLRTAGLAGLLRRRLVAR